MLTLWHKWEIKVLGGERTLGPSEQPVICNRDGDALCISLGIANIY